uniref:Interleukin-15 receptor subunit alpha n=1 Tax=Sciurus vulgaris TaxID=55149 RepID=A0A8D2B6H2_SCIVU
MARRRLRGYRVPALRALLPLLLLLRPPVTRGTTCPTPVAVEHADIRVKSHSVNSRERYVCNSGFKRKAGTSSLTECVFNKTTNTTHWTTPSLRCIRDPSLIHQRPVPPSTVVPARVTPQPESPSPSGKEPAVLSPNPDITVTTETAMVPGSQLMPSQPPSAGTTSIGSHESSQVPSQTTAKTLELTPANPHETPDATAFSSRETTVIISTSVTIFVVLLVYALVIYIKLRQTSQPSAVEMENMEVMPMTLASGSREEDGNCSPKL